MKLIDLSYLKDRLFSIEILEINDWINEIDFRTHATLNRENSFHFEFLKNELKYKINNNIVQFSLGEKEGFFIFNKENLNTFFKIVEDRYIQMKGIENKLKNLELPYVISMKKLDNKEKTAILMLFNSLNEKELIILD